MKMRRITWLAIALVGLFWDGGPMGVVLGAPAPPPPLTAASVRLQLERAALDRARDVDEVLVEGDEVSVCLDLPLLTLRSDPEAVEGMEEEVARALAPLDWRVLRVAARDERGGCRPLSDLVPQPTLPPSPSSLPAPSPTPATQDASGAPEGAPSGLAGKTVYVSAGHGWQWNSAAWRTQRPPYQKIIEDHNNAEVVLQFLVPYLEGAGATVVPVRERDRNPARAIADNDGSGPSGTYSEVGSWKTGPDSGYAGGAYRLTTSVTETATATATWTLTVPHRGEYALYAWVRPAGDRAPDAHYAIHHAGGMAKVNLDQRVQPETWRYLGTFPFLARAYTVTLDNASTVADASVVADALRLGGGTCDDLAGIETTAPEPPHEPWWEMATFYYSQLMGMEQPYGDVTSRPIYARWRHRGRGEDAVYLSWHSNGYNGDNAVVWGTESYVHNEETYPRTEGSLELQAAVHDELIHDLRAGWDPEWTDRGKKQRNLGEVRLLWDDDPAERMPGVLLELAFHDHVTDAQALRDPRFNRVAARAVYQGVLHYFEGRDGVDLVELPEPPTHLRVQNGVAGQVRIAWHPSPTDEVGLVGDAATGYRLYTSPDGFAWGHPTEVAGTEAILEGLIPGETLYVRVTATNEGGESLPTEVLGARAGDPSLLLVNGFDKLNRFGLVEEVDPTEGYNLRMWLERMNRRAYAVHHGDAVPATRAWDAASNEAVAAGLVDLDAYATVDWILGEETTDEDGTFAPAERAAVSDFLAGGGSLLVSGSEFAWELEALGAGPEFLHDVLHTDYVADDAGTYTVAPAREGAFAGLAPFTFDAPGEYDADYPDVLAPRDGGLVALTYAGGMGGAAGVQYEEGDTRLLVLGFPLEVVDPPRRSGVMRAALDFLAGRSVADRREVYLPLLLRAPALPSSCEETVLGGFEGGEGWTFNRAVITTTRAHEGSHSVLVGLLPEESDGGEVVYSSVSRAFAIPEGASLVTLRYWALPFASALDEDDFHYASVYDEAGAGSTERTSVLPEGAWEERALDLTEHAGQEVTLYLGVRNDGDGDTAASYLDDVVLEVCR